MNRAFSTILPRSKKFTKRLVQIPLLPSQTMNLKFSTLASVLATGSAWVPTWNAPLSTSTSVYHLPSTCSAPRSFGNIALRSTVTPSEEIKTPALSPQGKPIADGQIVSSFKGGLIAVRIDDDLTEVLSKSSDVLDTTNPFLKDNKSSSFGEYRYYIRWQRTVLKNRNRTQKNS